MADIVAPRGLDDHLDEVPRAALNARRARVPVTVSFMAIRSHAPASTSSKVRREYGSTLYRRNSSGSLDAEFAPETAVNFSPVAELVSCTLTPDIGEPVSLPETNTTDSAGNRAAAVAMVRP